MCWGCSARAHTRTCTHCLGACACACAHTLPWVANQHPPVRSLPQPQQHLAGIAGIAHCTNSPNLACTGGRQWKTHITSDENSRTQCLGDLKMLHALSLLTEAVSQQELRWTYQACESQESADSIQCFRVILAIALPLYLMGVKIAILLFLKTQLQNWGHSHAAAPKWLTSNSNSLMKSNSLFMTFLLPNSVHANCSDVNCPLQGWWWPAMLSSPCCVALHWQNVGKTLANIGKHWENINKHWQTLANIGKTLTNIGKNWPTLAKHWENINKHWQKIGKALAKHWQTLAKDCHPPVQSFQPQ